MRNVLLTTITAACIALTLSGCATGHMTSEERSEKIKGSLAIVERWAADIEARAAARRARAAEYRRNNPTLYCTRNGDGMICR